MDIPQVGDQVRKAPTQAIRAVFAGIGKMLLAADRPQSGPRPAGPRHAAPGGRAPQTAAPGGHSPQTAARHAPQAAAATATASQRWRSLDETGNVRLLSTDELTVGDGTAVAATPVPSSLDGDGQAEAGEPITAPAASQPLTGNVPVGAGFVVHELPLPGYDTMPIASVRARLRSLGIDQLHALLVREHKNAKRPQIIAMIERRIQKLENGG
jgi:hypothetical protein